MGNRLWPAKLASGDAIHDAYSLADALTESSLLAVPYETCTFFAMIDRRMVTIV